jgi:hypothetical protein
MFDTSTNENPLPLEQTFSPAGMMALTTERDVTLAGRAGQQKLAAVHLPIRLHFAHAYGLRYFELGRKTGFTAAIYRSK